MRLEEASEDRAAAALATETGRQEVSGFHLRHHAKHLLQTIHRCHGYYKQRSAVRFCELSKVILRSRLNYRAKDDNRKENSVTYLENKPRVIFEAAFSYSKTVTLNHLFLAGYH